ncbi:MAG: alpha/beta hydrolase, partial [Rhodocyclaceae bacterium]|nr:alpha/beta hydrolase [Rhodocyclaceae bacterium]
MKQDLPHGALPVLNFVKQLREMLAGVADPLGVVAPLAHAQAAWASHPQELAEQTMMYWTRVTQLGMHVCARFAGSKSADPEKPHPDDERFVDPVWTDDPGWDALKESYLLLTHHVLDMLHSTPGQAEAERRRAAFWWR